ncbi:hypothetical protein Q2941_26025 [Bradyrhizobium sp. UFLA05-153]
MLQRAEDFSGRQQSKLLELKNRLWDSAAVGACSQPNCRPACGLSQLTIALYIVTDMEYPRLGLIRIERFDHFLADAYEQMGAALPVGNRDP